MDTQPSENKSPGSSTVLAVSLAVLALLIMLYIFSLGPAVFIAHKLGYDINDMGFVSLFYFPLLEAADKIELYRNYALWWVELAL